MQPTSEADSDNGKDLRPFAEAFLLIIVLPLAAAGLTQLAAASGSRSLVCSFDPGVRALRRRHDRRRRRTVGCPREEDDRVQHGDTELPSGATLGHGTFYHLRPCTVVVVHTDARGIRHHGHLCAAHPTTARSESSLTHSRVGSVARTHSHIQPCCCIR